MAQNRVIFKHAHHIRRTDKRPDGHSTPHPFGAHQHIGHHRAETFERPKRTRAAKTRLDFIDNEQRAHVGTTLANSLQISGFGDTDARFGSDDFNHNGGCAASDLLYVRHVAVFNVPDSGQQRAIITLEIFIAGKR